MYVMYDGLQTRLDEEQAEQAMNPLACSIPNDFEMKIMAKEESTPGQHDLQKHTW